MKKERRSEGERDEGEVERRAEAEETVFFEFFFEIVGVTHQMNGHQTFPNPLLPPLRALNLYSPRARATTRSAAERRQRPMVSIS